MTHLQVKCPVASHLLSRWRGRSDESDTDGVILAVAVRAQAGPALHDTHWSCDEPQYKGSVIQF